MRLAACGRTIELQDGSPLIMGIVNIGDDSVADPLHLQTLPEQLARARRLLADGAAIIDIGVQSGRTDTEVISEQEEIERLLPLVSRLAAEDVVVSVDTWRSPVAAAAVRAGALIVNDVSGLSDPGVAEVCAGTGAALVLMHTRAAPKAAHFPGYEDALSDVASMLSELMSKAGAAGVRGEQMLLDPGLDFAKTPQESIEVLRRLHELHALGRPLLLAVSRKYFVGMLTGRPPADRLSGTLAAVAFGVQRGAQVLRVHDVAEVADFLAVCDALNGQSPVRLRGDAEQESLKWLPPKEGVPTAQA